jgi:hypothetical protein
MAAHRRSCLVRRTSIPSLDSVGLGGELPARTAKGPGLAQCIGGDHPTEADRVTLSRHLFFNFGSACPMPFLNYTNLSRNSAIVGTAWGSTVALAWWAGLGPPLV